RQGLNVLGAARPTGQKPGCTPGCRVFVFCADAECAAMSAKSEALAKAKKALRKFAGALSSPILIPSPIAEWGPLSPESLKSEIAKQRVAKLDLLFAHYGILPNDKDRLPKLATRLAVDFVPGMITVEQRYSPFKKRSHKDKAWTLEQYADLVRGVDANRGVNRKEKIIVAIYALVRQRPKEWGAYKGRQWSLVPRYHEGKKKLATYQASSNKFYGLWNPS